jgi:hypothetical protein
MAIGVSAASAAKEASTANAINGSAVTTNCVPQVRARSVGANLGFLLPASS